MLYVLIAGKLNHMTLCTPHHHSTQYCDISVHTRCCGGDASVAILNQPVCGHQLPAVVESQMKKGHSPRGYSPFPCGLGSNSGQSVGTSLGRDDSGSGSDAQTGKYNTILQNSMSEYNVGEQCVLPNSTWNTQSTYPSLSRMLFLEYVPNKVYLGSCARVTYHPRFIEAVDHEVVTPRVYPESCI